MLAEHFVDIATPWDPPTPIDTLISQITKCWVFATEGGDLVYEAGAVRTAIIIMETIFVFTVVCRDWRAKTGPSSPVS